MKLEFTTKLNPAKKEGKTLRATVPTKIVEALELKKGDSLLWELDKHGDNWIVTVKPKHQKHENDG